MTPRQSWCQTRPRFASSRCGGVHRRSTAAPCVELRCVRQPRPEVPKPALFASSSCRLACSCRSDTTVEQRNPQRKLTSRALLDVPEVSRATARPSRWRSSNRPSRWLCGLGPARFPADPVQQQVEPGQGVLDAEPAAHDFGDPYQRPALVATATRGRLDFQLRFQSAQLTGAELAACAVRTLESPGLSTIRSQSPTPAVR